tara:strand:- start:830 stop:2005 length:1176 start_codon:yes stop_codon:yes gene_type:complete
MDTGPKVTNDNLVFGYDTGYGVADKNTSTRFYKGTPTTNEINFANSDLNNWSSYENGNDGTFTTEFGTVGVKINNRTSWNGLYKLFTLPSTGTYTFSGWFRYRGGTSNNNGAAVYISSYGGSDTSTWLDKTKIGEWQRVTKTVNVTDVTVYFYFISYGGTQSGGSPDKSSWDVTMPQIEKLSDVTPFVAGTRSSTENLIDLKRTTTINTNNVSFDSSAQPEFDGTDDYIDLGADVQIADAGQGWTAEYVFNSDDASVLQHFNGAEEDTHNANWLALLSSYMAVWDHGVGAWKYGSTQFSDNTWYHIAFVQETGTSMQFYVNGVAEGGNHASFSWTASRSSLNCRYVGRYEHNGSYGRYFNGHIPVAKLYSNPLTAAEIKRNYKAYKNRFNI